MTHIAYIAPFDLRRPAGHTSHVLATVREFARKGHRVTLLAVDAPDPIREHASVLKVPGLPRDRFAFLLFGVGGAAILSKRLVQDDRPDVVYARYFRGVGAHVAVAERYDVPLVLELNSELDNERRTNRTHRFLNVLETRLERYVLAHSAGIVAVTDAVRHSVLRRSPSSAVPIRVVHNGVDTSIFKPRDRAECARKFGLDPDRPRLVFTGALQSWQGITDLAEATAIVARTHPDVQLVIAGDGPERTKLDTAIRTLGIQSRVEHFGLLSEHATAELICSSSVAVAPYNTDAVADHVTDKHARAALMRGSPLKIYAYMACGVPVVASHFHEAGAHVAALRAGIAVPPCDPPALARAIADLLSVPEQARLMGQAGRQHAIELHDWSVTVDDYLRLILTALRRHR